MSVRLLVLFLITLQVDCNSIPYISKIPLIDLNSPQTSFRGNFCLRLQQFLSGNLSLTNGLKGMTVSIAVDNSSSPFFMVFDPVTGYPNGGFSNHAQVQIAESGGFTIQYVQVSVLRPKEDYTKHLYQTLTYVDFYGKSWYSDTVSRRVAGLGMCNYVTFVVISKKNDLW